MNLLALKTRMCVCERERKRGNGCEKISKSGVLYDYKIIYFKERKLKFELLKSVLFINVYQRIYSCVKGFVFFFCLPRTQFSPFITILQGYIASPAV